MNWGELWLGVIYGAVALILWFVLFTVARAGQARRAAGKVSSTLIDLTMFVIGLCALGFSLAALANLAAAVLPALSR